MVPVDTNHDFRGMQSTPTPSMMSHIMTKEPAQHTCCCTTDIKWCNVCLTNFQSNNLFLFSSKLHCASHKQGNKHHKAVAHESSMCCKDLHRSLIAFSFLAFIHGGSPKGEENLMFWEFLFSCSFSSFSCSFSKFQEEHQI